MPYTTENEVISMKAVKNVIFNIFTALFWLTVIITAIYVIYTSFMEIKSLNIFSIIGFILTVIISISFVAWIAQIVFQIIPLIILCLIGNYRLKKRNKPLHKKGCCYCGHHSLAPAKLKDGKICPFCADEVETIIRYHKLKRVDISYATINQIVYILNNPKEQNTKLLLQRLPLIPIKEKKNHDHSYECCKSNKDENEYPIWVSEITGYKSIDTILTYACFMHHYDEDDDEY